MTTYNTYQEAKIANPEEVIFKMEDGSIRTQSWINANNFGSQMFSCMNPADYCMTVEHFLNEGLIFTEGDLILDCGTVFCVTKTPPLIGNCFTVESSNTIDICDNERYVLRAAALEDKKPRTKVEYVKCEYGDKVSNIVMDFENNAPLYKMINDEYWTIDELDDLFSIILDGGERIYRRIETPMTEREAFVEQCEKLSAHADKLNIDEARIVERMYDSGKFKLVN